MDINRKLSEELGVSEKFLVPTIALIDEGNTIPFIARYRKEITGGMTDVVLRTLEERLNYLRGLEERKAEVLKTIEEQGKLTEELKAEIENAEILQRVEDLYKPFKQKKSTRAGKAKELGLEPLAEILLAQELTEGTPEEAAEPFIDPEKEVETAEDALAGACDIIAEKISDDPDNVEKVRSWTREHATIATEAVDPEEKTPYEMYYEHSEPLRTIPNHRVLAINRGEKDKKLKVRLIVDVEIVEEMLKESLIDNHSSIFTGLLDKTAEDAYKRLMAPSIERELRNELTERAQKEALKVFAANTKNLLMAQPVKNAKVLAIDPGQRTGCKLAALDWKSDV